MDKTQISTSELKSRCSKIIRSIIRGRRSVIITKRGRPVAKLVPIELDSSLSLFGFARGNITIHGDIIEPLDVTWEAGE